jgi:hypothetical protein
MPRTINNSLIFSSDTLEMMAELEDEEPSDTLIVFYIRPIARDNIARPCSPDPRTIVRSTIDDYNTPYLF